MHTSVVIDLLWIASSTLCIACIQFTVSTVGTILIEGKCFTKSISTTVTGIKLQNAQCNKG